MFGFICWCVAFPLALAAEAMYVIAGLELFVEHQPRPTLMLVAGLTALFAVSSVVIGHFLRRVM